MRAVGDGGPRPVDASLARVLGRLGVPATVGTLEAVFTRWEEIAGLELCGHVRPVRVDGRVLVVMVDHPSWATRARMAAGRILAGVNEAGAGSIERLEVVVERA
ncbi:MAG TPA: DUF721 domain-containing protein [Acidimicrobiales bacterium]|nr:DUF721 domain-containing protein [Acidimicrobiales bacterium]